MKFLENIAKKFTKTASVTAKKEVKKTIVDLIPGILTVGSIIVGFLIFHDTDDSDVDSGGNSRPYTSTTRITTNNYFLGDVSDEIIKKILEDQK